eukprot:scaffold13431_cov126-Isochrysis_galbana.AAC.5
MPSKAIKQGAIALKLTALKQQAGHLCHVHVSMSRRLLAAVAWGRWTPRTRHAGEGAPKALLLAFSPSQGPLPGLSPAVCAVRGGVCKRRVS